MSNPIIKVNNLSKRYRIGAKEQGHKTFREAIVDGIGAPLRNLAKLRKLTQFKDGQSQNEEDVIWALRNVSFEVDEGEVLGIIGKNGAGKSTVLKVLSRITEPTSGFAEINGRVSSLLEVGTGFHPELTGRENIFLNGAILGMRKREIEQKFDEIVNFSEIERFIDTPVKRYSSGMYVRLAFGVAAHLEPEILLVDEVLAVGDVAFQKKCLGKMRDVAKGGRTVLFVSHNMPSIVNLCQRAILLNAGKVMKDGPIAEVVQHYLATARSAGGEVVWNNPAKAPGSENVRLHAVRVLSGDGAPTADVNIDKDVLIQIDFWNFKPGIRLVKHIWICDQFGGTVVASANRTSACRNPDPWFERPHPIGLFRTLCRIPANLLNDKTYSINVYISSPPQHFEVNEVGILSFRVYDNGAMRKESPSGEWVGVIRVAWDWATKHLGPLISSTGTEAN